MISIEEAKRWIKDKSFVLDEEFISIDQSVDRVLAHDILATMDLPSFRNSAMDGYAVLREDLEKGMRRLEIVGETQAGKTESKNLQSGTAIRVFTGAVVPDNSDMVVIQEKTEENDGWLIILSYSSEEGNNIREIGEQIEEGEPALKTGHKINPASVGLFASFGISEVSVYRIPKVGVITTGNELKKLGENLDLGEIYESNSFSLKSALRQRGYDSYKEISVSDDPEQTRNDIGELLKECDVLIMSGGISVGKYDFVKEALEKNGVDEVFYKVKQKPGKPMYFGVKEEKLVFALPGNPASLLVCFYQYVLTALNILSGRNEELPMLEKRLASDINFSGNRPEFMRAHMNGEMVQVLEGQSSFMLKSFAEANCLIYIHGEKGTVSKGSTVKVFPIY